jgi:3-methyladenine DNA glycosylase Mpg
MSIRDGGAENRILCSLYRALANFCSGENGTALATLQRAAGPTPQRGETVRERKAERVRVRECQNKREQSSQFGLTPHLISATAAPTAPALLSLSLSTLPSCWFYHCTLS